jgi:YbgC/YbaW family acyl-CoA thioester hydrolase
MQETVVELAATPGDCDGAGTVSHAGFVQLFERARWQSLGGGPGMDAFERQGVQPAVRRSVFEVHAPARPGQVLRFAQAITHLDRTSFTLRQVVRRALDDALVATAELLIVCVDRQGRAGPVPDDVARTFLPGRGGTALDRVSVNGVSLAVEVRGTGPALVFIHGFPLDLSIWRHQLDGLTGYRRIGLDLRGMGRSDAPDLGYSMATYADDLAALLASMGEERVVLIGHSMGGYVAFEFVRRYRDRVRALVLVDTRAEADSVDGRRARDALILKVREQGATAAAEAMLPRFFTAAVAPHVIESVRAVILHTPVPGIIGALGAMRERSDSTPLLPTLAGVPSLVVVGADDVITPPSIARVMAAALPAAQLVEIGGAGHVPSVEQPEATSRALSKFLRGLR